MFTWASMEGLKGKADERKEGVIRINRFGTYVSEEVFAKTNGRQQPEVYIGRRGNEILVQLQ